MKDAERSKENLKTITAMGKEATRYVKALVPPGDTVRIEFDAQNRDKYGKLLGYVYLSNGKMLNEEIVKAGYANLMTIPPNVMTFGESYIFRIMSESAEGHEIERAPNLLPSATQAFATVLSGIMSP